MATQYTPDYVTNVFLIWYQKGKPHPGALQSAIPEDSYRHKPSTALLAQWIRNDFMERAKGLDDQVNQQIAMRAIAIKIEMLERHAKIGSDMQDMALEYLDKHRGELSLNSSVRLLIEGVRIERESRGLPEALEGLSDKSDEQLMKEIEKIVASSPVLILPSDEVSNGET